jgi:hypothetical protein
LLRRLWKSRGVKRETKSSTRSIISASGSQYRYDEYGGREQFEGAGGDAEERRMTDKIACIAVEGSQWMARATQRTAHAHAGSNLLQLPLCSAAAYASKHA